eukprot:787255-Prymnesium_polylepis.1
MGRTKTPSQVLRVLTINLKPYTDCNLPARRWALPGVALRVAVGPVPAAVGGVFESLTRLITDQGPRKRPGRRRPTRHPRRATATRHSKGKRDALVRPPVSSVSAPHKRTSHNTHERQSIT